MKPSTHVHLPRDVAVALTLLTAYACLHPCSGWHAIAVSPFAFLFESWPRYYTWRDIVLNVLGFIPLAFSWATVFRRSRKPGRMVIAVWLAGTFISLCVETTQNYLPTRVSSNLDLATNSLGSLIGACVGLCWGKIVEPGGPVANWLDRRIMPGAMGSLGLLLVGLWWFSLLNPSSYLFANGDLHPLVKAISTIPLPPEAFMGLEAILTAANLFVVGILVQRVMRRRSPWLLGLAVLIGLGVKTLATTFLLSPSQPWHWATHGGLRGLAVGVVFLAVSWSWSPRVRHTLAAFALLLAAGLVNLAPVNPYWEATTRLANEGHVLNFSGTTRLMASTWPFFALLWMGMVGPARRDRAPFVPLD